MNIQENGYLKGAAEGRRAMIFIGGGARESATCTDTLNRNTVYYQSFEAHYFILIHPFSQLSVGHMFNKQVLPEYETPAQ